MSSSEVKLAGFWIRFLASCIDTLILVLVTWGLGSLFYLGQNFEAVSVQLGLGCIYTFLSLVYFTIWTSRRGTTLGKKLFKLYVVGDQTMEALTVTRSLLRAVGYWLSWLPMGAGYLMVALGSNKTALHDVLARSRVIYGGSELSSTKAGV